MNATTVDARRRFDARFGPADSAALVVIDVCGREQALDGVDTALAAGAAGVFLRNDNVGHQALLQIASAASAAFAEAFIGVHCRDLRPQDVLYRLPPGIEGVWVGSAESPRAAGELARALGAVRSQMGWEGLLFGRPDGTKATSAAGSSPLDVLCVELLDLYAQREGANRVVRLRVAEPGRPVALICGPGVSPGVLRETAADCFVIDPDAAGEVCRWRRGHRVRVTSDAL